MVAHQASTSPSRRRVPQKELKDLLTQLVEAEQDTDCLNHNLDLVEQDTDCLNRNLELGEEDQHHNLDLDQPLEPKSKLQWEQGKPGSQRSRKDMSSLPGTLSKSALSGHGQKQR